MIFITVGTQLNFDRLIKVLDDFYFETEQEVFAQIGPSKLEPKNIGFADFLSPKEADEMFKKASLIIAHAGMGSILTALKYEKPILVMPRKASLGEHRNEHQIATANWVKDLNGVSVADDETDLIEFLKKTDSILSGNGISPYAEERLINYLKEQINQD
jgi:UDP-N-acetylglucosamine transferase subunit ALG13